MAAEVRREGPFAGPLGQYVRVWYDDGTYQDVPLGGGGAGGGTSSIDEQGNLVHPSAAGAPAATPGTPLAAGLGPPPGELDAGIPSSRPQRPIDVAAGIEGAGPGGGGYASDYSRSGRGYASGYGGGGGYDEVGGGPFANLPPYQTGQLHPAAGGAPLVPGGMFAPPEGEAGYDDRRQMTSESGATAGPFGTRAAPAPRVQNYGGSAVDANAYSGSGGARSPDERRGPHPLYSALRAKGEAMSGRLRGMAASIGTGGGGGETAASSYDSGGSAGYRRTGRLADRYYADVYEGVDPRVHGWARRQRFKPGTINAALGDPTTILPAVFPGFTAMNTATSNAITDEPMTDLAIIARGTQNKRGLTTRTPMPRFPRALQKAGYEAAEPATKRILDPSDVVNTMRDLYLGLRGGNVPALSSQNLLTNLATARKNSVLRQGIRQMAQEDPRAAIDQMAGYVRAALSQRPMNAANAAILRSVDNTVTNMGPQLLRQKPKKLDRSIKALARQYL